MFRLHEQHELSKYDEARTSLTVTSTSDRFFITLRALKRRVIYRPRSWVRATHQLLKIDPCCSSGASLMSQHARWHISCESVFRMRSTSSTVNTSPIHVSRMDPTRTFTIQHLLRELYRGGIHSVPVPERVKSTPLHITNEAHRNPVLPLPVRTPSGRQKSLAPHQFRSLRYAAAEHSFVELFEEGSRVHSQALSLCLLLLFLRHTRRLAGAWGALARPWAWACGACVRLQHERRAGLRLDRREHILVKFVLGGRVLAVVVIWSLRLAERREGT